MAQPLPLPQPNTPLSAQVEFLKSQPPIKLINRTTVPYELTRGLIELILENFWHLNSHTTTHTATTECTPPAPPPPPPASARDPASHGHWLTQDRPGNLKLSQTYFDDPSSSSSSSTPALDRETIALDASISEMVLRYVATQLAYRTSLSKGVTEIKRLANDLRALSARHRPEIDTLLTAEYLNFNPK
jgi:hypothetical protein